MVLVEEDAIQCGRNSGGKSRGGRAGARMARVQSGFNELGRSPTRVGNQALRSDDASWRAYRSLQRSGFGRAIERSRDIRVVTRPARAGRGITREGIQIGD